MTEQWLNYLKPLTQSFKWSKQIHVETVFKGFPISKFNKYYNEISYKTLFELFSLYNSLLEEDKKSFINTVRQHLNNNYEAPVVKVPSAPVDDLPF